MNIIYIINIVLYIKFTYIYIYIYIYVHIHIHIHIHIHTHIDRPLLFHRYYYLRFGAKVHIGKFGIPPLEL